MSSVIHNERLGISEFMLMRPLRWGLSPRKLIQEVGTLSFPTSSRRGGAGIFGVLEGGFGELCAPPPRPCPKNLFHLIAPEL